MKRIVVASNNAGKIKELKVLLSNYEVVGLKEAFDEPIDIVEDGTTFKENALIKARAISEMIDDMVIADDSGIEIDAFDKKPGVESARFLGHETSYDYKNQYILDHIGENQVRTARYVCAIACCQKGMKEIVVEDTFEGEIAYESKGENGFGYDPIFYVPELGKTAAQLSMEEKNKYSHRAKALRSLVKELEGRL